MNLIKLLYTNQYTIMIIGVKIKEYISEGISFNQETTLSGKRIIINIKMAKDNGFHVVINYIGVDSPEIAKERVKIRVENGNHGIPEKDIERRYYNSLKNLKDIISICDEINIIWSLCS